MHRTHESGVAIAPAHHLGNGQGLDRILHDGREHVREPSTRHGGGVEQRLGLAVHAALKAGDGIDGDALGFHLLEQSGRGLALGVERDRHRHELFGDFPGGALGRDMGHCHRQAARAGVAAQSRIERGEPPGLQAFGNARGEGFAQTRQGLGRQLFGEQFNKQGCGRSRHHAASLPALSIGKPSASRDSK